MHVGRIPAMLRARQASEQTLQRDRTLSITAAGPRRTTSATYRANMMASPAPARTRGECAVPDHLMTQLRAIRRGATMHPDPLAPEG